MSTSSMDSRERVKIQTRFHLSEIVCNQRRGMLRIFDPSVQSLSIGVQ